MQERIGKKKNNIFALDVESHNDEESIMKGETSIWLGCLIDENSKIDDETSYFYSIEELLERLKKMTTPRFNEKRGRIITDTCIYIYNLSFEWSFILPVILANGFKFKEQIGKQDEYVFNSVSTKSCSSVWEVQMKFDKKNGLIRLRDLAKIFGGGLGFVAKSFNLPTQKGEIDYRLNRLHNYTPTREEKEYCFKDTRIIIDILLEIKKRNDKDFWNVISMASYSMKHLLKSGYGWATKPYKEFRKGYPNLPKEENEFLRKGVEGGITYATPRFQFKDLSGIIAHCDFHQMHPSSAYFNLFPYGKGEYFTGTPPKNKICACRIRISYDYVLLHSIIKLIGIEFVSNFELIVWDFEIATMKLCYGNLEVEYLDGYAYNMKMLPWRKYYADNYRLRLKAKQEKDDFNILYYKLLNNSSYGKLLEKPHNTIIQNIINENGIIDSIVEEKNTEDIVENAKYTYLPVGSCIPAYSRCTLIRLALRLGWEKVIYFDTDSIFFIWDEETKAVWDKENQTDFLGGCAMEEFLTKAQFTAPKRYKATTTEGKTYVKSGGFNFDAYMKSKGINTLSYEEVNIVNSKYQVQRAYRVKGGTIIDFQTKEISIQDKYKDIYLKNVNEI